tara:strand:- start:663 stop:1358 length:696 start_codon:yes stop_codon:yes gene_type:complete
MIKSYVITIKDNPRSVEVAQRCIDSAKEFGIDVNMFDAITPNDKPSSLAKAEGISLKKFKNDKQFSRYENCVAAFLSHRSVWQKAIDHDEHVLVLEHDAVFTSSFDISYIKKHDLISLGYPSYGRYQTPFPRQLVRAYDDELPIITKAFSKPGGYLPGAHAYVVSPTAAKQMLELSKDRAEPTDLFLNNTNFTELMEYYPWPIKADDSFTTIQKEEGCIAKHNYKKGIDIV